MTPPVAHHPLVELGDLRGAAGLHDEAADTGRAPVVEVLEAEAVADLVEEDVDVLLSSRAPEEVLAADALAPVAAGAAAHPRGQPQRQAVSGRGRAHGHAAAVVDAGVDGHAVGPLQGAAVAGRPAHDVDLDVRVGPAVPALDRSRSWPASTCCTAARARRRCGHAARR